eukprot:GHRR01032354.1.p1 GENE.GHRR01032354.1~~GHRR01032354.1.p1  ORF type:complete len:300 (+),score=55.85 GHRR01032354.1:428-1327(+)
MQQQLSSASLSLAVIWLAVVGLQQAVAQCPNATYTGCPTALSMAQLLTGNNSLLPISNANFSGRCNATAISLLTISDFGGCHYLSSSMPSGAIVLSNGQGKIATYVSNTLNSSLKLSAAAMTDADLQAVSQKTYSQNLFDIITLTFDITPTVSGPVYFQYVFGSEEYPEYAPKVGGNTTGSMNDIFAFFMRPSGGNFTNIALLPSSNSTPVSIASVNIANHQYYVANHANGTTANPNLKTELDGLTKLMNTSSYYVTANQLYNVKLGISDGGDAAYDSVVWVKGGSLTFSSPPVVPTNW